jgi:hypothetical protein
MEPSEGGDMNETMRRLAQSGAGLVAAMIANLAVAQTPVVPKIPDLSASVQEHFQQADANHSGGLDRIEALGAGYSAEKFEAIDTNHDHVITLYEISAYLAERTRDWARADTNGDGVVTREEAAKVPSLAKIFTKADKDGDGVVRRQEQEAFSETTLYRDVDLPSVVPNIIDKKF